MSGDVIDHLWERLTGFAPYTPVTVSGKTTPETTPPCPSENDLIDPYGSGPVPIVPKEARDV